MSAFNDRRVIKDRRHGDRRWLGIFTGRKHFGYENRKISDRRTNEERRENS